MFLEDLKKKKKKNFGNWRILKNKTNVFKKKEKLEHLHKLVQRFISIL